MRRVWALGSHSPCLTAGGHLKGARHLQNHKAGTLAAIKCTALTKHAQRRTSQPVYHDTTIIGSCCYKESYCSIPACSILTTNSAKLTTLACRRRKQNQIVSSKQSLPVTSAKADSSAAEHLFCQPAWHHCLHSWHMLPAGAAGPAAALPAQASSSTAHQSSCTHDKSHRRADSLADWSHDLHLQRRTVCSVSSGAGFSKHGHTRYKCHTHHLALFCAIVSSPLQNPYKFHSCARTDWGSACYAACGESSATLACLSAALWSKPAMVQECGDNAAVQFDPTWTQRCTCFGGAVWSLPRSVTAPRFVPLI